MEGDELRELREAWNYRQQVKAACKARDSWKRGIPRVSMVGRIVNQDKRDKRDRRDMNTKTDAGILTAIIFACIPAGSFATPPAKPLVEDPALEGGLPVNPAVLAACTVASGEALPLD